MTSREQQPIAAPAGVDRDVMERTEFAWQRSALGLAGVGLLIVRRALPEVRARPAAGVLLGLALAAAATLVRVYARRRPVSREAHMRLITGATLAFGALAFAVAANG